MSLRSSAATTTRLEGQSCRISNRRPTIRSRTRSVLWLVTGAYNTPAWDHTVITLGSRLQIELCACKVSVPQVRTSLLISAFLPQITPTNALLVACYRSAHHDTIAGIDGGNHCYCGIASDLTKHSAVRTVHVCIQTHWPRAILFNHNSYTINQSQINQYMHAAIAHNPCHLFVRRIA
jgi:hypothetical protein